MTAIGISFGNPTGGAGFDVSGTVNQIVANLQTVETPWKTQLSTLTAQDSAFTDLGSNLAKLTTDLQNLTDANGVLANKEGSSSDTDVLTLASASSTAVAGTHTVVVQSLAQTSSAVTPEVSGSDVFSGGVTIQVGSGVAHTIAVDSSAPTLAGLSAAINAADIGVVANVVTDTTGSRLSIVSGTGGTAGQLTVSSTLVDSTQNVGTTGSGALALTNLQSGADALLTVDGLPVTSGTNTVSNAIPGVTFQLLSGAPSETVDVVITNNAAGVAGALTTLVDGYNTVIQAISAQEGKDASGNAEPLYGSPVLAQLQQRLQSALSGQYGSGSISSLSQFGIETAQDGTLTINSDTLTDTLNNNYKDASAFFQNAGSFGRTLATLLNNLSTTNPTGSLALALTENKNQETTLNTNVSNQEATIAASRQTLTAQLTVANQQLQAIPQQLKQIDELYSAITGYNQGSN